MTIICMNSKIWRNNIMDTNNFENIDEVLSVALRGAADTCNMYMFISMKSQKLKAYREQSLSHASSMRTAAMILTNNSDIINKIDKDIQYYKDEIEGYDYIIKGCEKVVTAIQNLTDEATKSFNNDKESLKQFLDEMKRNSEEETGGMS